jgi:hypothetical protein
MAMYFRYGEGLPSYKFELPAGEPAGDLDWEGRDQLHGVAFDVKAVFWEIMACEADLDAMLWEGRLSWCFVQAKVSIAHLAYCSGSWGNLLFPDEMGDLERLAGTGGTAPSEEAWRALTQAARLTDNTKIFRGKRVYGRRPVLLPGNATWKVLLRWDREFTPVAPVRMRIGLDGVFKNQIEIG